MATTTMKMLMILMLGKKGSSDWDQKLKSNPAVGVHKRNTAELAGP